MSRQPITRYIHDGEWAIVSLGQTKLAVYPCEEGTTFTIGRPDEEDITDDIEDQSWRNLDGQTNYQNMPAAIAQARWLLTEPDILKKMWW